MERDYDAITVDSGLKRGNFYVIGTDVYLCFASTTERNEIHYNNSTYLLKLDDFRYQNASLTYSGKPVTLGDGIAKSVNRGQVVTQNGRYYIVYSNNGWFAADVNCEAETTRLFKIS